MKRFDLCVRALAASVFFLGACGEKPAQPPFGQTPAQPIAQSAAESDKALADSGRAPASPSALGPEFEVPAYDEVARLPMAKQVLLLEALRVAAIYASEDEARSGTVFDNRASSPGTPVGKGASGNSCMRSGWILARAEPGHCPKPQTNQKCLPTQEWCQPAIFGRDACAPQGEKAAEACAEAAPVPESMAKAFAAGQGRAEWEAFRAGLSAACPGIPYTLPCMAYRNRLLQAEDLFGVPARRAHSARADGAGTDGAGTDGAGTDGAGADQVARGLATADATAPAPGSAGAVAGTTAAGSAKSAAARRKKHRAKAKAAAPPPATADGTMPTPNESVCSERELLADLREPGEDQQVDKHIMTFPQARRLMCEPDQTIFTEIAANRQAIQQALAKANREPRGPQSRYERQTLAADLANFDRCVALAKKNRDNHKLIAPTDAIAECGRNGLCTLQESPSREANSLPGDCVGRGPVTVAREDIWMALEMVCVRDVCKAEIRQTETSSAPPPLSQPAPAPAQPSAVPPSAAPASNPPPAAGHQNDAVSIVAPGARPPVVEENLPPLPPAQPGGTSQRRSAAAPIAAAAPAAAVPLTTATLPCVTLAPGQPFPLYPPGQTLCPSSAKPNSAPTGVAR